MTYDLPPRSLTLVVMESIVCFALTVVSLVGNTMLCLAVYRNPMLRSSTNLYIIALSVGDLICATLEMPLTFWTLVVGRWIFGDGVCQVHGFVDVFSTYCPPATMALTAFNRYIRIVKTGYYRKIFSPWRSKLWLFCVWFLLISYLLVARLIDWQRYDFVMGFAACSVMHYTENRKLIHYCLVVSLYFGVSFSVVIVCYFKIFKAIRQHQVGVGPSLYQERGTDGQQAKASVQEIKTSKTITFVLTGFLLCWIPMWSLSLTNRFSPVPVPRAVPLFVSFFIFLSSSINPVIYAVTNRGFRREFRRMILCARREETGIARVHVHLRTACQTFVENFEVDHLRHGLSGLEGNGS
ncbi:melatonin receptor type 1A-like [Acropora palmata]|uniref:melatonin receptor type 1A-like n=1 Tax=Acropora palmata TaxID=6131 RepID=UPI003DA0FBA2